MNLYFDKEVFAILKEPEFENYKRLKTQVKVKELKTKSVHGKQLDLKHTIGNP